MTDTPYLSIGDFSFNPPATFWKRLAKRHKISNTKRLKSALIDPLIWAKVARTQKNYTHRKAIRTVESMLKAINKFNKLCEGDYVLTHTLMRRNTDEPGQLTNERDALTSSLEIIERRLLDTQASLQSNDFVSVLINQGPGRPRNERHGWLWLLWVVYCDHSPQRGLVNRGKSELGEYSGDFYEFASAICKEAGIPLGSHDLATSIQRIIRNKTNQKNS